MSKPLHVPICYKSKGTILFYFVELKTKDSIEFFNLANSLSFLYLSLFLEVFEK